MGHRACLGTLEKSIFSLPGIEQRFRNNVTASLVVRPNNTCSVEPKSSLLCSFYKYTDLFNSVLEQKCNVSSDAAHVACNPSEKVI